VKESPNTVTLDWLFARCVEVDGCLVWQLAGAHGTDPQAKIGGRNGRTVLLRRFIWEQVYEKPFPNGKVARCNCGTDMCVHPDHIVALKKNASQIGRPLSFLHRAKLAASRRAKSHLTDADVAEIRASDWTPHALANRFSIDPSYVNYIRSGRSRRDYTNPYAQLGAI
jgi:hypothetical protein